MLNADRIAMEETEKELKQATEKMLLGVAIEYGKDSPEYEVAGGTRTSKPLRFIIFAAVRIKISSVIGLS